MTDAAAEELVLVRDEGSCRWLVLNRPDKLNAFNAALTAALRAQLEAAIAEPSCRVVVLTGSGRAFSAGQDLEERRRIADRPIDLGASLAANWHPLLRLVQDGDKPVVGAVNGIASGAALNLVLACDVVVAARRATFTQPFVRIGLMPDCGGSATLPRLVGAARARALAMLAPTLSAETAERIGLIWRSVEDDELDDEARAIAARLAEMAPLALAATKRALRAAEVLDRDGALSLEADLQRRLGASRDYAEGVAAFFDKRPPRFTGA